MGICIYKHRYKFTHTHTHTHSASVTEQILGPWLTVSEQGWGGREPHLEFSSDVHLEDSGLCWDSQRLTGSSSSWTDLEGTNLFQFPDESVNTESLGKEYPLYCLFPQWSSVTLWSEHLEIPRREVLLRCRRAKMCVSNLTLGHWSSSRGGSYRTRFESFGRSPAWSGSLHVPSPWVMNATPLERNLSSTTTFWGSTLLQLHCFYTSLQGSGALNSIFSSIFRSRLSERTWVPPVFQFNTALPVSPARSFL